VRDQLGEPLSVDDLGWRDGFRALAAIAPFSLSNAVYRQDAYGSQILARLSRAPRFSDINPLYLHTLLALRADRPYVKGYIAT
jgi:hypothetical protein